MRRIGPALAAAGLLALAVAAPASAISPTFERPSAASAFGEEIVFRQAFDSPLPLARVEILLEFPASLGPHVVEATGAMAAGRHELSYRWSLVHDGHLAPNTAITGRWRLVPADRTLEPLVGPPVTVTYSDTRFAWRTLKGDIVRLHWYQGPDSFGRRALAIGEEAVRAAAELLGVTETEPIDFFVYPDEASFYDALGPGTRENVGGQAHSDTRTMFALIRPGDVTDRWVEIVIPHELTHLVFDTAVRNPFHFPPRWLNEGVAVYLSEGYTPASRSAVEAAAAGGRLMPLRALGGQFPTTFERFSLAYALSVSAVDFLVRDSGPEALVDLIRIYADGVTDDEAFTAAVGTDLAGFESAWLADLGAEPPTRHGPQPAPAGPLPPGWGAAASPDPPDAAPAPGESPATSAGPPPADPAGDDVSPQGDWRVLAIVALAGLMVGGGIAYGRRRRARGANGGAAS
ncbi:MAG TPA: peptidase MA family metallohydrolase [Patescibacteria group bacterium]|nr:peptidase MA family metallohydrolase [Patescibacteria group bacterium]